MSLRGTVAVAAYSLAGGAFRYTAEEPLSQFWWSLTAIRIGCCLALERVLAAFPVVRLVVTAFGLLEAYTHNVRGRIPTDRLTKGVALVTGSTAGIGFQTCILLCERGVDVWVPARSVEQAVKTAQLINEASKGPGIARPCSVPLDLASRESVKKFAESLTDINLLVLNAGVMMPAYHRTEDGAELTIAANHLGHFQLATALAPRLKGDARVVVVSSALHRRAARRRDIAQKLLDFRGDASTHKLFDAYATSKLQNVLFAHAFASRNPQIACVACHPGFVFTSVTRHLPLYVRAAHLLAVPFWVLFQKTPRQGAHCSLHCCLSPSFSAASLRGEARFVADCRVEREGLPPQPRELAEALWRRSEAFVTNVPFSLAYIDTLARLFGLGISRGLA